MSCWCDSHILPACEVRNGLPSSFRLTLMNDPACLFVDVNSIEGKRTGLVRDSVVSCLLLMTDYRDAIDQVLGSLSPAQTLKLNDCLKAALAIT